MPLKIKEFTPEHVAVLNRWATQQEQTANAHKSQLTALHTLLQSLFDKNPTLKKP